MQVAERRASVRRGATTLWPAGAARQCMRIQLATKGVHGGQESPRNLGTSRYLNRAVFPDSWPVPPRTRSARCDGEAYLRRRKAFAGPVRRGPYAGPMFQACRRVSGGVQRLGSSIGSSRDGVASIPTFRFLGLA